MINYEEFTQTDYASIPQQDFYKFIVLFAEEIIEDVEQTNQGIVAQKLCLHLSHFNAMLKLLRTQPALDDRDALELGKYMYNSTDRKLYKQMRD